MSEADRPDSNNLDSELQTSRQNKCTREINSLRSDDFLTAACSHCILRLAADEGFEALAYAS